MTIQPVCWESYEKNEGIEAVASVPLLFFACNYEIGVLQTASTERSLCMNWNRIRGKDWCFIRSALQDTEKKKGTCHETWNET